MSVTVPAKVEVVGTDQEYGRQFIGPAKSQLRILENQLRMNGFPQGRRMVTLNQRIKVHCWVCFNFKGVTVYCDGGGKEEEIWTKECPCNCNFTVGLVKEIQEETIDDAPLYIVSACKKERQYTVYENILASDWTKYEPGERVIMIAYNDMEYLCCSTGTGPTGCSPLISDNPTTSDAWRSTVRIIPWCGADIPKWINIRKVE